MNKRALISLGTIFMVVGLGGMAVLQTDLPGMFRRPPAQLLESPDVAPTAESPAVSDQAEPVQPVPDRTVQQAAPPEAPTPGAPDSRTAAAPRDAQKAPPQAQAPRTEQAARPAPTPAPAPKTANAERSRPAGKETAPPAQKTAKPADKTRPDTAERTPATRPRPTVIRFAYDPAGTRDVTVARVHMGDRIAIRVKRFGRANHRLYLGFDLPGKARIVSRPDNGLAVKRGGSVVTLIRDLDQLVLQSNNQFGTALTARLDSKAGADLKLGVRDSGRRHRGRALRDTARYQVEIAIYSGNRWNLQPRSCL